VRAAIEAIRTFPVRFAAAARIAAMSRTIETKISDDGLRYRSRVPGTPFSGAGNTRSCFKCGCHRLPSDLQSRRILGRTEFVCKPSCAGG
jgi:hypothetical protein